MSRTSLSGVAAVAVAVALTGVPFAFADQVFHTSHAAVHALAGAPLRSGFVNDMHTNGIVNGAREGYHLNGAQPNTTYEVQLVAFASQNCSGSPFATFSSSQLTTNGAGNGNADAFFPAGPPNDPPIQVGVVWQFLSNGVPVYATDCVPVTAD
jgi:hypothetical protein